MASDEKIKSNKSFEHRRLEIKITWDVLSVVLYFCVPRFSATVNYMDKLQMTYQDMAAWLGELGVETDSSIMSFSVNKRLDGSGGFEWGSHDGVYSLLSQKRNLLSPSFWRMISEIFNFKNHALR